MRVKFFTDRYPNQDKKFINLSHESLAITTPKSNCCKRVWITIDVPSDEQLWPEQFTGEQAKVVEIEIQQ